MESLKDHQFEHDWSSYQEHSWLKEKYGKSKFETNFYKLIAKRVIAVLSPQLNPEPHNLIYDDELVHSKLIGPLERFIFDLPSDAPQEDVDEKLAYLKTLKQPTKMCHKVLKGGDVLFSCNDCGFDWTCVLCIDCFHKSAHKDHNYRMANTDGGGCCDCGDVEAWKQFPACSDHAAPGQQSLKLSDYEDVHKRRDRYNEDKQSLIEKISLLPQGMASRYYLVCQAAINYARILLLWEQYDSLPAQLDLTDKQIDHSEPGDEDCGATPQTLKQLMSKKKTSKNWFTVLFNDEIHTYDFVIDQLTKIVKCSKMTASIMASSVSREGRSFIFQDQHKPCKEKRDMIAMHRENSQKPLKVEVIHGAILAHQAYALKLLEWIRSMASICDGFRVLTAFTLLLPDPPEIYEQLPCEYGFDQPLEQMMLANTDLWKMARIDWNELFVATLLTDYSIKEAFARQLTSCYGLLVDKFVADDHDYSVSILTMTTQLYTVPSLVCMLIEEEKALLVIADKLFELTKRESREAANYETRNSWDMHNLKRAFYIISDFRHLISIQPTKWTDELRTQVIGGVNRFLDLLDKTMQGMDSVRRQIGHHIEYEQEWESGMTLQSRLINLITQLVKYCSYDETVLVTVLRKTLARLVKDGGYKRQKKTLFGHTADCIQYDVATLSVSIHLPLTRFAAALILELMQRRPCNSVPYDESQVLHSSSSSGGGSSDLPMNISMIDIMEPSLRTEVMIAQFRSGMWRRNGYSLVNQIIYFSGALMRKEMYDRDILLLQECAATCDANQFMIHLLNKFSLINWVTSETTREPLVGPRAVSFHNDEEILTQTMSLGEEFLQILLTIIGERYRVGVGKVEEEDVIKNEIIQLLCISPYTRSDISTKLCMHDNEIDCVKHVANLKRTSESSTGKYELKEEYYVRFNPFFYHYSRRHQSQALDAQLKRKRMAKESLICCPPPEPVEVCDQFGNLNQLLVCDVTLNILRKILQRALGTADPSLQCSTQAPIRFMASDLQLDQCLHLIGLGLHEQARRPAEFDYIGAIHRAHIPALLKECYETAKRSTDLIFWLMKKTNDIIVQIETQSIDLDSAAAAAQNRNQRAEKYAEVRQLYQPILSACDTIKQESQRSNSELAAKRRERIMAMMKAKQNSFMSNPETQQLAAETAKHEAPAQTSCRQPSRSSSSFAVLRERAAAGTSSGSSSAGASLFQIDPLERTVNIQPQVAAAASRTSTTLVEDEEEQEDRMDQSESIDLDATRATAATAAADSKRKVTEEDGSDPTSCSAEDFVGSSHLCILCRDEQVVAFDKPTMVLLAHVQRSAVLSKNRGQRRIPNYALTPSNQTKNLHLSMTLNQPLGSAPEKYSFTSDNSWSFDASYMPADLFFGPYVSTCGHVMHYDCWKGFSDTIYKRESSRPHRGARHVSFELDKGELLCPLCECISNATIPLIPDYTKFIERQHQVPVASSLPSGLGAANAPPETQTVFGCSAAAVEGSAERLTEFLHALKGTVLTYKHIRHSSQQPGAHVGTQIANNHETGKYMRLLQPSAINDVLKDLEENEALALRDFITSTRAGRLSPYACTRNLLNSIQKLADRIHSIGLDLDRTISDVHHARKFMMTSWSISYTIQANERAARFKGTPLFDDLESSKNLCLSSLVRFAISSMMIHQSDMIQSLLIQKLRYLLVTEEHLASSPCCLDIDALELFVSIFIMLQKLYSHIREDTTTSAIKFLQDFSSEIHMAAGTTTTAGTDDDESGGHNSQDSDSDSTDIPDAETVVLRQHPWLDIDDRQQQQQGAGIASASAAADERKRKRKQQELHYAWTTCEYDREYYRNLLHLMVLMNLLQVSITIQNDVAAQEMRKQEQVMEVEDEEDGPQASEPKRRTGSAAAADDTATKEYSVLENFFKDIIMASGHPCCQVPRVDEQFVSRVKRALLPYLRSCAIFLYQLSHIPPGERLTQHSAFHEGKDFSRVANHDYDDNDDADYNKSNAEYEAICQYLNLPSDFSVLLRSKEARNLALTWLRHSRVLPLIKASLDAEQEKIIAERLAQHLPAAATTTRGERDWDIGTNTTIDEGLSSTGCSRRVSSTSGVGGAGSGQRQTAHSSSSSSAAKQQQQQEEQRSSELMPVKFIRQPHTVNRLIDLPYDYSELVDKVSNFTCPSIKNEDSRVPTMCLVCGVMLCSQSYCCQRDLNDLAANYKQVLRRQAENRQRWLAADPGSSVGGGGVQAQATGSSLMHRVENAGFRERLDALAEAQMAIGREPGPGQPNHADVINALMSNIRSAITSGQPGAGQDQDARAALDQISTFLSNTHSVNQQPVGACVYHAHQCSGGVGVFLRIRHSQILLLSGRSKGCYMPAPYIDDHGETDFGLQRGNPLHLNRQLYERLQSTWMNHTIPEQISRTLEYSPHASNINWYLH